MPLGTPQPADQFSRWMVAPFDDRAMMPAPGAFCTFFGRQSTGSRVIFSLNSNVVDIDIIRGNEKLAALVPRGINSRFLSGQKNTKTQQRTTFSRAFPLIEEEGDIQASQLNNTLAGESRYVPNLSQRDRLRELAREHHQEHLRRIARTYEFLAAQSVITGKMPAIRGTTNDDLIYDFRRNSNHNISVGTAWTNVASDIMGDIDDGCDLIRANGRTVPDMVVFSQLDMDSFIKNTSVQTLADNRRMELIEVSTDNPVPPQFADFVKNGFIPRGRLRTPKGYTLWMFTYIDIYEDDAGVAQQYLPDNKTILASSGARCDAYFGPGEVIPLGSAQIQWMREMFGFDVSQPDIPVNLTGTKFQDLLVGSVFADAVPTNDGKNITIRAQAAPIFATTQTDAFVVFTTS